MDNGTIFRYKIILFIGEGRSIIVKLRIKKRHGENDVQRICGAIEGRI